MKGEFPLTFPEAVSQGCRLIVSSAVPCCEDFVSKPEFGKIIPHGVPSALTNAMSKMASLYKDGDDVNKISAYVKSRFSWKSICKKT